MIIHLNLIMHYSYIYESDNDWSLSSSYILVQILEGHIKDMTFQFQQTTNL